MTEDDPARGDSPDSPPVQNPYVGLVPFGAADVAWFFGRDREREIIGANLRSSQLTLLYGASGVGKSSVLYAAVVPALREVAARDRAARELDDADERRPVRFAVATFGAWRDAPLEGLMSAVAASIADATGAAVEPWTPGTPLRETFAAWLRSVRSLLIVLDQFEEYFLYHPDDCGPGTFAGEFVEVVNDADLRVNFLLSLREDELAKLDRFQGRVPRLFDNYLRVDHLDLDAARSAVYGPLGEYNRRLPAGAEPATIDAELVDEVLAEVRTRTAVAQVPDDAPRATTDRVETPLLQLVMRRLWNAAAAGGGTPHLQIGTLRDELGGTENIVRRHLDEALDALSDDDRSLAVDVVRPLVSPTGTKIAWRAADLGHWAKRPAEQVEPILRELSRGERRILRPVMPPASQADQSPRYEIFHDILATPILAWCAEREEERERAELARELEAQALAREAAARENRRRWRRRLFASLALVIVGISLVAARLAFVSSQRDDSRALAAGAIAQLPFDPERSLLLAMRGMQRHDTPEARQALRLSLGSSRVRAVLGGARPRPCAECAALRTAPGAPRGAVTRALAIASDGHTVAAIRSGRVRLWRPRSGETFDPGVRTGTPAGVAFTPDARRLLVVGDDGAALMAPDGTRGVRLAGSWETGATAADSRHVVTVGPRGAAVWDARDGKRVARLEDTAYLNATFASSSSRILLQNAFGELVTWSWRSGRHRLLARAPAAPSLNLQYANGFAVDSGAAGEVRVVAASGATTGLPAGSRADPLDGAYISPDGSRIATVRRATVELWGSDRPWTAPARRVASLVHGDGVTDVAFSPDSKLVATASSDGLARVWETSTGGLVDELAGHAAGVESLAFSSSGRFLATTGYDLTVRLWDLGRERTLRLAHGADAVAATPSGLVVVAASTGDLSFWRPNPAAGRPSAPPPPGPSPPRDPSPPRGPGGPFPQHPSAPEPRRRATDVPSELHPTSVAVTADDRSVLVGYATTDGADGRAALVDLASGHAFVQIATGGAVEHVAVDRRQQLAAILRTSGAGTRADLWDLRANGGARRVWRVPVADGERLSDVAFSPDGRRLLVTSVFGAARIFDIAARRQILALATGSARRPGAEAFYRGVFSPDGATVAIAGSRDARLWDARSGDERSYRLSGHTSVLKSIAYDASGRRIVTASADGTVRVWDAADGTPLAVLDRHAGGVNDAAFLPGGWIVSAGDDHTVRAYPCTTCGTIDTLLATARTQVTRDLTARELDEFAG